MNKINTISDRNANQNYSNFKHLTKINVQILYLIKNVDKKM